MVVIENVGSEPFPKSCFLCCDLGSGVLSWFVAVVGSWKLSSTENSDFIHSYVGMGGLKRGCGQEFCLTA